MKQEIIKKSLGTISIFILIKFGLKVYLYSFLFTDFISQIINSYPNKKLINYSYIEQIKDILPILFINLLMCISVSFIVKVKLLNNIVLLLISIAFGIIVYILLSRIFKIKEFDKVLIFIKDKLSKRKEA